MASERSEGREPRAAGWVRRPSYSVAVATSALPYLVVLVSRLRRIDELQAAAIP
jgi:hypothetical protein